MTYLDTGCFVKFYYPEADTAHVIAKIQGKFICFLVGDQVDEGAGEFRRKTTGQRA